MKVLNKFYQNIVSKLVKRFLITIYYLIGNSKLCYTDIGVWKILVKSKLSFTCLPMNSGVDGSTFKSELQETFLYILYCTYVHIAFMCINVHVYRQQCYKLTQRMVYR